MNRIFGAAALGLALLPSAVFAQATAAPGAGPGPDGGRPQLSDAQRTQLRAGFDQSRKQMEALHTQFRSQMLGSLSAIHRTALANLIGDLAISPNPDYRGAAQKIDALLSANERQGVLNAASAFHTQSKALRNQQRQAFLSVLTPDQRAQMQSHEAQFGGRRHDDDGGPGGPGPGGPGPQGMSGRQPDAGTLLLMSSVPHGMFGFGGMHGHGPGGM